MDTRLTPEETEKLLNGITELLSKRHHLGVESAYADAQDIVSVFKSILAKLAAVPLDENMVHNCNKIIAKFLRDFDNEAHQYPIPILTQLLLSQLALYQNAKEIQARKEIGEALWEIQQTSTVADSKMCEAIHKLRAGEVLKGEHE